MSVRSPHRTARTTSRRWPRRWPIRRTGEPLNAGPRWFRYTFATCLLREGASPEVVRDLLDHEDLQTIRAHLNLCRELVEKFDAAMAMGFAPVALGRTAGAASQTAIPGRGGADGFTLV